MLKRIIAVSLCVVVITGIYHVYKPLPEGISLEGEIVLVPSEAVSFMADTSYVDSEGERRTDQVIFDEIFRLIEEAENFVLVDMFLYNDFRGVDDGEHRNLSGELTDVLVSKKIDNPDMDVVVITDPINNIYGSHRSDHLTLLEESGVEVVITDLKKLRDSNPVYSAFWRVFFQWFGESGGGILPNPFSPQGEGVSLRSYLSLFNFKANHRKVVVADSRIGEERTFSTVVTSANPHDGSSAHENVALRVDGPVWRDVLLSEMAVMRMSGVDKTFSLDEMIGIDNWRYEKVDEGMVEVQVLTEGKIRTAILELIEEAEMGDSVDMVLFYLSDRRVVNSLIDAVERGVDVRVVLDPNKDAFGREKNGIPNRQVAYELYNKTEGDVSIRWCNTSGEQCHSKMVIVSTSDTSTLILGSANLTRRNIGDLNLETNLLISGQGNVGAINDAHSYFTKIWNNDEGNIYTLEYNEYADGSFLRKVLYRVMEVSGMSSF